MYINHYNSAKVFRNVRAATTISMSGKALPDKIQNQRATFLHLHLEKLKKYFITIQNKQKPSISEPPITAIFMELMSQEVLRLNLLLQESLLKQIQKAQMLIKVL